MKKPFDDYPWFYEEDNRKNRPNNPISKEMLENKHEVLFPEEIVKGKKILDLWSCLWATGQWCLFYWASSYTGVEIQEEYVNISKKLLSHHWDTVEILHQSIEAFLEHNTKEYDVTVLSWVLYVFLDYYQILKDVTKITREVIIIDSMLPSPKVVDIQSPAVQILPMQDINLASVNGSLYGLWTRITPSGLSILLQSLAFRLDGDVLLPRRIEGHTDVYNYTEKSRVKRFLMRFIRNNSKTESLSENLQGQKDGFVKNWSHNPENTPVANTKKWEFDENTAKDFQKIALNEIPHYLEVIKKCLQIWLKYYDKDAKILDVWSALWFTLNAFTKAWFYNTFWVESSKSMIESSFKETTLIHDSSFPSWHGKFDLIMANWTLHFVHEREKYIQDIFNWLNIGGTFILTEKIASSKRVHDMYHDFKRSNWVSDEHIKNKQAALEWVLVSYPLEWYLNTLKSIGFTAVDIIDSHYSFVTIIATK